VRVDYQVAGLISVAIMLAAGQILFKRAAGFLVLGEGLPRLLLSLLSFHMAVALAVYGVATLLWVVLLHSIPLSRAYPFVALAFALVPLAAWAFFGETISLRYIAGLALMGLALYLITTATPD
jgi:drug/metabolite transporter (DMT)-like permease